MPSCALSARLRRTIEDNQLLGSGDRILVAVSGGADSTALAHVLPGVVQELGATVVGLAHLNHGLRPEAVDDERFCVRLAEKLALRFTASHVDVAAEARRTRTSIEDAARTVRYAFLDAVRQEEGATRVAVAHTLNDQAETVVLRLLRGAGPVGLAGIYPRAGSVVRPMLDVTRGEVEAYLRERGLEWREDATNRDVTIPRNRVRHELLPWLRQHFGAGIDGVVARQAPIFRDDADLLDGRATEIGRHLVLQNEDGVELSVPRLLEQPPSIARRIVLDVLRRQAGGRFVGFQHVDAVLGLAQDAGPRGATDLPGQRVERRGDTLRVRPVPPDPDRAGRRRGRSFPR
jgi:tRNA(Ile)-lysidine synthase